MSAFVMTVSTAPSMRVRCDCPIPSRMTFPPPNFTSSPYVVKSCSTSIIRSVSARRTLSPTVGPNICAYAPRLILLGMLTYLCAGHLFRYHGRQRAHYFLMESIDQPRAGVRYESHSARLPGLESHRGARGYVQAAPERSLSIKGQGAICFCKVIVTADLDWPVARVCNLQRNRAAAAVQNDLSRCGKNLSGNHHSLLTESGRGC